MEKGIIFFTLGIALIGIIVFLSVYNPNQVGTIEENTTVSLRETPQSNSDEQAYIENETSEDERIALLEALELQKKLEQIKNNTKPKVVYSSRGGGSGGSAPSPPIVEIINNTNQSDINTTQLNDTLINQSIINDTQINETILNDTQTNESIQNYSLMDLNQDGIVDLQDFGMYKDCNGYSYGDYCDNCTCDLNKDGLIDLQDFGLFKDNYG